jgi:hypothetical protein
LSEHLTPASVATSSDVSRIFVELLAAHADILDGCVASGQLFIGATEVRDMLCDPQLEGSWA